jgi:hypothetical protein
MISELPGLADEVVELALAGGSALIRRYQRPRRGNLVGSSALRV